MGRDVALGAGAIGRNVALDAEANGNDVTLSSDACAAVTNAAVTIDRENRNILCHPFQCLAREYPPSASMTNAPEKAQSR